MAREITAYVSDDGAIHIDKNDADFSDYSGAISTDVNDFMKQNSVVDKDQALLRLICKWELWKVGGFSGWLAGKNGDFEPAAASIAPAVVVAPISALTPKTATKTLRVEKKPTPSKKHIGIVGLFPVHQAIIEKEFNEAFKLTMQDCDVKNRGRLDGVGSCHKVFVMAKFVSHTVIKELRALGQEPILINGGIDKLRDSLTNLYVEG